MRFSNASLLDLAEALDKDGQHRAASKIDEAVHASRMNRAAGGVPAAWQYMQQQLGGGGQPTTGAQAPAGGYGGYSNGTWLGNAAKQQNALPQQAQAYIKLLKQKAAQDPANAAHYQQLIQQFMAGQR